MELGLGAVGAAGNDAGAEGALKDAGGPGVGKEGEGLVEDVAGNDVGEDEGVGTAVDG